VFGLLHRPSGTGCSAVVVDIYRVDFHGSLSDLDVRISDVDACENGMGKLVLVSGNPLPISYCVEND
jgi:hypothetical protein